MSNSGELERTEMKAAKSQRDRVLEYIKKHGSITALEAMNDLGVMRLASRISDLRKAGHFIKSEMISVCNRFEEECKVARYTLAKDEDEL